MPPARPIGVLLLGVAALTVRPVPVATQPEPQMWLSPDEVRDQHEKRTLRRCVFAACRTAGDGLAR